MLRTGKKALSLLIIALFIWGLSFPVIKHSLEFLPPIEFLFYRLSLASLILVPLAFFGWKTTGEYLSFRRVGLLTMIGLFGPVLALLFLYLGLNRTTVVSAVLILAINPVVTRWLMLGLRKMKLNAKMIWGTLVILLGVAVVMGVSGQLIGNLMIVAAAVIWAFHTVISKIVYRKRTIKNSPITLTALAFLGGVAALVPAVAVINPVILLHPILSLPKEAVAGVLYLGILSSILGFIMYEAGSKMLGAIKTTRILYWQPVIAIPVAVLWLGEVLSAPLLLGAGIIALGVFLFEKR